MAVLSAIDVFGTRTEDGHAVLLKRNGKVVGYLSARRDDDTHRLLKFDDVEHAFE